MAKSPIYPSPSVKQCIGEKAIDSAQAKAILGWQEETDAKVSCLLKDRNGKRIRCEHNVTNRPLYRSNYEALVQEILRGNWRYNMEPIIIDEMGQVLNGQHQLIAVVLATQDWEADRDKWPAIKRVAIDKLICFGADGSDEAVNTMDTCKPRTLADVIYRAPFFRKYDEADHKALAKMANHAVNCLWDRTGACINPYAPRQTHAESISFIERHNRLLEAVVAIHEENEENRIKRFIGAGYAAGLLYLMGTSTSNQTAYHADETPTEATLDFKLWDIAVGFWVALADDDRRLSAVRETLAKIVNDDADSLQSRYSVLVSAWNLYVANKPITVEAIYPKYETDADGFRKLVDFPSVGGIDYGNVRDTTEPLYTDPTPAEIANRAEAVNGDRKPAKKVTSKTAKKKPVKKTTPKTTPKTAKTAKTAKKKATKKVAKKAKKTPAKKAKKATKKKAPLLVGSLKWVCCDGEEPWAGRVVDVLGKNVKLKIEVGHLGAGTVRAALLSDLHDEQPTAE